MNDDLNTPQALAVLFDLAKEINRAKQDTALCSLTGELAQLLVELGAVLGIALGHGFVELAAVWLAQAKHIHVTGVLFLPEESWLLGASLVIGLVAALLPAIRVYRIDIFKTLVQG